jgi:hypothetical protein
MLLLQVRENDSVSIRKKAGELHRLADQELLFTSTRTCAQQTDYIYIVDDRAVGLVTVERIDNAYTWIDGELPSNQSTPALLGVYKLWVCSTHRNKSLASKLLDAARQCFLFNYTVPHHMIAFTCPTKAGASFAKKYTNKSILVYKP